MSNNSTTVTVDVKTNLAQAVAQSETLKKNLQMAGAGRQTYAQAAAAKGASAGGVAAEDSNTARGIGGMTGAAGRDFAAQAKGLGGLVHVYATFAANLFAVSAAFTALNKAANITNMVKGLDQLGAAAGRNLGNLAKQVTYAADGALSLADAMTAVAQASSGGMTNQNILRMTEVAKKAAQALGRDMPDAMNRLSRGITKIEPELLDELGIMVKVNEASTNYARTLGKSALALTDFEKRQGYANAVLAEGEKKFSEISLAANPYQKILASITNIAVVAGEAVNKVLGPVLNFLSSSPTALSVSLAALAAVLFKQAIPALGQFRINAAEAAAATSSKLISTFKDLETAASDLDAAAQLRAEARFKNEANNVKKIQEVRRGLDLQPDKTRAGRYAAIPDITKKDPFALTESDLALVDKRIKALNRSRSDAYRQDFVNLANWRDKVVSLREGMASVSSSAEAERVKQDQKLTSHYKQVEMVAERAALKTSNARIKGMVAETAATYGSLEAFKLLNKEIQARSKSDTYIEVIDPKTGDKIQTQLPKVTGFFGAIKNGATYASGALTIATAKVNTLLAAFGPWLQLIALVGAGIAMLTSYMSNNTKEAEAYAQSLEAVNSSFDNMANTIEKIEAKDPLERLSVESIIARSNALEDLNGNLSTLLTRFNKNVAARNTVDKFTDWLWDKIGKGDSDKLSKQLSQSISAAIKGMEEGSTKELFKTKMRSLLGSDDVDFNSINSINDQIKDLDETVIASKAGQFGNELRSISKAAKDSANNLASFKQTLEELDKEFDKYVVSLKATDSLSKMGEGLLNLSTSLGKAFEKPLDALVELNALSRNISALSLLPENTSADLIKAGDELKNLNVQLSSQASNVKRLQDAYDSMVAKANENSRDSLYNGRGYRPGFMTVGVGQYEAQAALPNLSKELEAAKVIYANTQKGVDEALNKYKSVSVELFKAGSDLISQRLTKAFAEGALIVSNSYVSTLKSLGADTAVIEGSLQKQEISLQEQDIKLRFRQIELQIKNNLLLERNNDLKERDYLEMNRSENKRRGVDTTTEDAKLKVLNTNLTASEQVLNSLKEGTTQALYASASNKKIGGSSDPDNNAVLSMLQGFNSSTVEKDAQMALLAAKRFVATNNTNLAIIQEISAREEDGFVQDIKSLELKKEGLELAIKLSGEYNAELESKKRSYEIDIIHKKKLIELSKTNAEINKLEYIENVAGRSKNKDDQQLSATAKARKEYLISNRDINEAAGTTVVQRQRLKDAEELAKLNDTAYRKEIDNKQKLLDYNNSIKASYISLNEQELNSQKALGTIYDEDYITKQANNELTKQNITYANEQLKIEDELGAKKKFYAERITALEQAAKLSNNLEDIAAYNTAILLLNIEQAKSIGLLEASKASGIEINNNKLKELEIQRALNLELAEQDKRTKDIVKATTSLALLFGKVGAAIGTTLGVITKMAERENKYAVQKLRIQKEIEKHSFSTDDLNLRAKASDNEALAQKELARVQEDSAIDQMNYISAISAATKEAFEEKTSAYKAFQAVEKAAAAYSLAMQAQQHAKTLAELPAKIASGTGEIFKQLGAYGFPVAAAFLALMASLGASKGGSTSVPPIGNTAEERQKIQGTGQKYDSSGKLVGTGGGVFGDQEAKSESIKNSLEIIKDNTIEGLGYDRKMLEALESIDRGINSTAKSLYSVVGLRNGSIFGNADISTSSGGGLLKTLFGGLFGGSKTTNEIIDSGIEISGTFGQLAKSAKGLVRTYETIRSTKVSKGFLGIGGGTSISDTTSYKLAPDNVTDEVTAIFKSVSDLFVTVGEKIGLTVSDVTNKLNSIDVGNAFTSLRGLKGEELEKEFSAVIGSILDDAASKVFSTMSKYAEFGEGLLETTVRVVDGFDKVKVSLSSIAVSVNKFTYDISEALIKNAGGLDEFTGQLQFFSENFLTEAERLAPISANVNKVMSSLGLAAVDSREEFAYIVKSLDLTTTAGRDTYQQLMDIAQAFSDVHAETRTVISVEERLSQLRNQYVRILELEGKKLESVALSREIELESMDEALKLGAKYIWAMEDELDLKNQLTDAHEKEAQALQSTIDGLVSSIDALNKYKDSLQLGAQSVLTPSQKYTEAKAQAEKVAEIANSIAVTEAEKKAKNEAISSLPAAAGAFLEASRTMFASSAQYTTDYNSVLALVGSTSAALEVQKSTAEMQLDTLNAQYDSLGIIKDSTMTMAELMPKFLEAQERTIAAMGGYYDAGGPGQAPVTPTNGIDQSVFSATVKLQNDALIKEVQLLNKQIDALRKEQNKQTADLVIAQKAVAEAKLAADKAAAEAAAAANWNAGNSPWYDSSGAWVSTGA